MEIRPDEWRTSWATGSSSGSGGNTMEIRIEGGVSGQIDPATVQMDGPDGTALPVQTEFGSGRFTASFLKTDAIAIVSSLAGGDSTTITVSGLLTDGTAFSLDGTISVRDDS